MHMIHFWAAPSNKQLRLLFPRRDSCSESSLCQGFSVTKIHELPEFLELKFWFNHGELPSFTCKITVNVNYLQFSEILKLNFCGYLSPVRFSVGTRSSVIQFKKIQFYQFIFYSRQLSRGIDFLQILLKFRLFIILCFLNTCAKFQNY